MHVLAVWPPELVAFMANTFGAIQGSAAIFWIQLLVLFYIVSYSIQVSATSIIGFDLGAGEIERAKKTRSIITKYATVFSFFLFLLVFFSKSFLGRIFTKNEQILTEFEHQGQIMQFLIFFDSV